jgi:hypothetical protein
MSIQILKVSIFTSKTLLNHEWMINTCMCLYNSQLYFCTNEFWNFRSSPELLTLTAVKHLIEGTVTTEEVVNDLLVTLM